MDTTRRYPRTASEAFKGADYASSIIRYRTERSGLGRIVLWLVVSLFLLGAMLSR